MTTDIEKPTNWYFSFGHGQVNFNKYVKIHGTVAEARASMFKRYGTAWSMQYAEDKALEAIERWGWTEVV
jgi:hypothetical protein